MTELAPQDYRKSLKKTWQDAADGDYDKRPALATQLGKLLVIWREVELGQNPVWDCIHRATSPIRTDAIREHLGNIEGSVNRMLVDLKTFRLIKTETHIGFDRFHEINWQMESLVSDFIGNVHGKYFEPEGSRGKTINVMIERCRVISRPLSFVIWQMLFKSPKIVTQTAIEAGCSTSDASKTLSKLKSAGLVKSASQGTFEICSGINGLTFLQDAQSLVGAGIIKL